MEDVVVEETKNRNHQGEKKTKRKPMATLTQFRGQSKSKDK
jgi:hypothetical protein